MNKYLRITLNTIYAVGLLLLVLFSGSKYDWMNDMDPSMAQIEDGSGNRAIFLALVFAVVLLTQLIVVIKAAKASEKAIACLLTLVGILAYVM